MQVTGGYGDGGQSGAGGKDKSDGQAFRRGRRVGQIVRGRLVSPGPGGLFWVVIDGHKLLAALDHEPVPERELVFRIERLEPELTLRDITPPPSATDDPVLLLAALTHARSKFEAQLRRFAPAALPPPGGWSALDDAARPGRSGLDATPAPSPATASGPAQRFGAADAQAATSVPDFGPTLDLARTRADFQAFCRSDPAAGQALATVMELVRLTGQWIPKSQGRPIYAPWMYPGISQSEGLALRTGHGTWTLRLFGRLPEAGRVAAVVTVDGSRAAYRLMLENPAAAEAVIATLARVRLGRRAVTAVCQSVGGLPAEEASGSWARILAGAARPFTGLHLRV
ncbi:MAG: hypothetical protein ACLGQH_12440 [Acidobacteriota bacterium]